MQDVLGYSGQHVVVTGAASGMGAATARILLDLGARVTALDVKPVEAAVDTFLEVDLRDRAAIEQAASAIEGPVHSIASCAGLPGTPFSDVDTMLVNFVGARHLIELLVPKLADGSSIGLISSAGGFGWQNNLETILEFVAIEGFDAAHKWCEEHTEALMGGYLFSKQVIDAWVGWRGADLIKQGIRLNCINPGPTSTPMMPSFHAAAGKELIDSAIGPIGRYSEADEQAWPLVLLNSPRMSYVSGEVLWTDGGFQGAMTTGKFTVPWASND